MRHVEALSRVTNCRLQLQNMQLNPSHYSFLRLLGPEMVRAPVLGTATAALLCCARRVCQQAGLDGVRDSSLPTHSLQQHPNSGCVGACLLQACRVADRIGVGVYFNTLVPLGDQVGDWQPHMMAAVHVAPSSPCHTGSCSQVAAGTTPTAKHGRRQYGYTLIPMRNPLCCNCLRVL